jgi:hypothetical protein
VLSSEKFALGSERVSLVGCWCWPRGRSRKRAHGRRSWPHTQERTCCGLVNSADVRVRRCAVRCDEGAFVSTQACANPGDVYDSSRPLSPGGVSECVDVILIVVCRMWLWPPYSLGLPSGRSKSLSLENATRGLLATRTYPGAPLACLQGLYSD